MGPGPDLAVLERPLPERERPTEDHNTLEIAAYWKDSLFDTVRAGRRRRLTVGGYKQSAHLRVELPLPKFTIARVRGPSAEITVPDSAHAALRNPSGEIERAPERHPVKAPFPAYAVQIGFGHRLALRIEDLTFVCQFVYLDQPPPSLLNRVFGL